MRLLGLFASFIIKVGDWVIPWIFVNTQAGFFRGIPSFEHCSGKNVNNVLGIASVRKDFIACFIWISGRFMCAASLSGDCESETGRNVAWFGQWSRNPSSLVSDYYHIVPDMCFHQFPAKQLFLCRKHSLGILMCSALEFCSEPRSFHWGDKRGANIYDYFLHLSKYFWRVLWVFLTSSVEEISLCWRWFLGWSITQFPVTECDESHRSCKKSLCEGLVLNGVKNKLGQCK